MWGGGGEEDIKMSNLNIPLSPNKNNGFSVFNGGYDNPIIYLDNSVSYILDTKRYIEKLMLKDTKILPLFGIFFLHYGLEKRGVFIQSPNISISKYAKTNLLTFLYNNPKLLKTISPIASLLLKNKDQKKIDVCIKENSKT